MRRSTAGDDAELEPVSWARGAGHGGRASGAPCGPSAGPRPSACIGGARLSNEDAYAWAKLAKGVIGTDSVDAQLGDGLPAELVLGLPRATIDEACAARVRGGAGGRPPRGAAGPVPAPARGRGRRRTCPSSSWRRGAGALSEFATASLRLPTRARRPPWPRALAAGRGRAPELGRRRRPGRRRRGRAGRAGDDGDGVVVVLGRPSLAEDGALVAEAAAALAEAWPAARFLPALRRGNVMGALDMGLAPGLLPGPGRPRRRPGLVRGGLGFGARRSRAATRPASSARWPTASMARRGAGGRRPAGRLPRPRPWPSEALDKAELRGGGGRLPVAVGGARRRGAAGRHRPRAHGDDHQHRGPGHPAGPEAGGPRAVLARLDDRRRARRPARRRPRRGERRRPLGRDRAAGPVARRDHPGRARHPGGARRDRRPAGRVAGARSRRRPSPGPSTPWPRPGSTPSRPRARRPRAGLAEPPGGRRAPVAGRAAGANGAEADGAAPPAGHGAGPQPLSRRRRFPPPDSYSLRLVSAPPALRRRRAARRRARRWPRWRRRRRCGPTPTTSSSWASTSGEPGPGALGARRARPRGRGRRRRAARGGRHRLQPGGRGPSGPTGAGDAPVRRALIDAGAARGRRAAGDAVSARRRDAARPRPRRPALRPRGALGRAAHRGHQGGGGLRRPDGVGHAHDLVRAQGHLGHAGPDRAQPGRARGGCCRRWPTGSSSSSRRTSSPSAPTGSCSSWRPTCRSCPPSWPSPSCPVGGVVTVARHTFELQVADPPVGILFLLAMSSVSVYGVMLAGLVVGLEVPAARARCGPRPR